MTWESVVDCDEDSRIECMHAWVIENLSKGRVRIMTQEAQLGKAGREWRHAEVDELDRGHQEWIKGLAKTVLESKGLPW